MKIELLPIKQIKEYAINAKQHPEYQVEQIRQSIQQFGNNDPIAIDEEDVIIEGHGRYLALKSLGYKEIPVIRLTHLSTEEKKAYILAHNKITLNTGFDLELLKIEFEKISNIDMSLFVFSPKLFEEPIVEIPRIEVKKESIPQAAEGEIYQLGEHRLICGDCTKPVMLEKLLKGKMVDLYLTDPPYNVNYEGKTEDRLTIQNDQMEETVFKSFLTQSFRVVDRYLKPGGAFYIWHAETGGLSFRHAVENVGWLWKQTLIWVKNHFVMGRQDYHWQHEPCLYGWKDGAAHYFITDRTLTTILESEKELEALTKAELIERLQKFQQHTPTTIIREVRPQKNQDHPTMKPVQLMERLIRNSTKKGEVVLDTFGGSGSTLLACENLDRVCYMVELDPKYIDVIIERWEKMTGKKAVKST